MDWRVAFTTFGIIFLAELGDKTQIAAMTMAAQKKRPWEVFIGAAVALVAVSAIGVVVGSALGQYLPVDMDQTRSRCGVYCDWSFGIDQGSSSGCCPPNGRGPGGSNCMPQTRHVERHFTAGETIRDVVIGMSDGLTVPFALAAGLTGAIDSAGIIVTAGFAEIAAGAIAMGLGGYLAARSDAEHYAKEREREHREVIEIPGRGSAKWPRCCTLTA